MHGGSLVRHLVLISPPHHNTNNNKHRHYYPRTRTRGAAAGRMSRPERQNTPQNYYNPKVRGGWWVGWVGGEVIIVGGWVGILVYVRTGHERT